MAESATIHIRRLRGLCQERASELRAGAASGAVLGAFAARAFDAAPGMTGAWRRLALGAARGALAVPAYVTIAFPLALERTRALTHAASRPVDSLIGATGGIVTGLSLVAVTRSRVAPFLALTPMVYAYALLQEDAMLWRYAHTHAWERTVASIIALSPLALLPTPARALSTVLPLALAPQLLASWLDAHAHGAQSARTLAAARDESVAEANCALCELGPALARLAPARTDEPTAGRIGDGHALEMLATAWALDGQGTRTNQTLAGDEAPTDSATDGVTHARADAPSADACEQPRCADGAVDTAARHLDSSDGAWLISRVDSAPEAASAAFAPLMGAECVDADNLGRARALAPGEVAETPGGAERGRARASAPWLASARAVSTHAAYLSLIHI